MDGGCVPIGYDCVERRLVINQGEATSVRRIFELYRDLGNVKDSRRLWKMRGSSASCACERTDKEQGMRILERCTLRHLEQPHLPR